MSTRGIIVFILFCSYTMLNINVNKFIQKSKMKDPFDPIDCYKNVKLRNKSFIHIILQEEKQQITNKLLFKFIP